MPRKLDTAETFDTLRDEINYTEARLTDEPLTASLAGRSNPWTKRVNEIEQQFLEVAREGAGTDAARTGANQALDAAVVRFADLLLADVRKDRESVRWRAFFRTSVSDFNRIALADQAAAVRGWLTGSSDPVLLAEKANLEVALARTDRALARDAALTARRASVWVAREALAAELTEARDTLHDDLSVIARAGGLSRDWADSFFRVGKARENKAPPPVA